MIYTRDINTNSNTPVFHDDQGQGRIRLVHKNGLNLNVFESTGLFKPSSLASSTVKIKRAGFPLNLFCI